jgi:hypothetical protein
VVSKSAITAYIFWSVLTSLVPTLFYFSVWELAIGGAEIALLSTLSPIFLGIPPFLSWIRTRNGQTTMHALSFLGLAAYALHSPVHRLLVVTFATGVFVIRQVVDWTGNGEHGVEYQGIRKRVCWSFQRCYINFLIFFCSGGPGTDCVLAFETCQPCQ